MKRVVVFGGLMGVAWINALGSAVTWQGGAEGSSIAGVIGAFCALAAGPLYWRDTKEDY